jgi:hypothetical protein
LIARASAISVTSFFVKFQESGTLASIGQEALAEENHEQQQHLPRKS